ncbi:MAG: RNA methyltransferase, partial [Proteobacteria bacterium]|nr:RNA methyltransferase [Pseudomonadota bacterium]
MSGPVIILVRPQMGENIGMTARAMANFGLRRLRIVAPRDGWPPAEAALQAAAGASALVTGAEVFPTVEAAAADLTRLFATTARERGQAKPVLTPDLAMAEAARHSGGAGGVGILFGPERTGLENDE